MSIPSLGGPYDSSDFVLFQTPILRLLMVKQSTPVSLSIDVSLYFLVILHPPIPFRF